MEETNLQKFLKDEIDMIIECYEEEKYENLNEADIKEVIERLNYNDYLWETVNDIIVNELDKKCEEKECEE